MSRIVITALLLNLASLSARVSDPAPTVVPVGTVMTLTGSHTTLQVSASGSLTLTQLQTIKANILATPELAAHPNNSDGAFAIATYYAVVAAPDFWVYRTSVTKTELTNSVGPEGTTFTWVGNGFITRSVGEQAAWRELGDPINLSLSNVRQALVDIYSGTGNAALNRTHLAAVGRRKATRIEKLLATGTGSTASPALMGFEGVLSVQDVQNARSS